MGNIADNLRTVHERIKKAAEECGRDPGEIKLLAVSKTNPVVAIKEAYNAGQMAFGENYAQDFKSKAEELSGLDIEWHFIGHLQRNKVKYVAPFATYIHSLNSIRLADEIDKRALRPIRCFVELNLASEESKTGLARDGLFELVKHAEGLKNIELVGLMTMPPFDISLEETRKYFIQLREIRDEINKKNLYGKELKELSMGMTADLEVAIAEGSTVVRVGTAIFGERE